MKYYIVKISIEAVGDFFSSSRVGYVAARKSEAGHYTKEQAEQEAAKYKGAKLIEQGGDDVAAVQEAWL